MDYHAEARKKLDKAKELFKHGQEKDAYSLVSEAIRFFLSHKLGLGKELTATECIRLLKSRKQGHIKVQKCLNLCGLVEFAKYKPDQKDFSEITGLAEKIIG